MCDMGLPCGNPECPQYLNFQGLRARRTKQPDLSWPKGTDPHTHAIALLDKLYGRCGHAPSAIFIVENYLRENFYEGPWSNVSGSRSER